MPTLLRPTSAVDPDAAFLSEDPPLTRREWVLVVAFWVGWGLLSVGNRVLDPIGGPEPRARIGGALAVAALEAVCWIGLTPAMFRLVARVGTERTPWPVRAALFGGGPVVIALALALLGATVRHDFAGAPGDPLASHGEPAPRPPDANGAPEPSTLEPPALGPPPGPPYGRPPSARGTPPGDRAYGPPARPPGGPPLGAAFAPAPGPPLWFGFLNALLLALGVLAAGVARAYALRYRVRHAQALRLRGALDSARLDALRRQLDPHFLFNTLNAVAALVDHDPTGVRRMIARLGELLRFSFSESDEPEISLRRELALLSRYVEIMQVRFHGALAVETRVDDRALDLLVPAMILQPLVENAIKHGVERLDGAGTVRVTAALERDAVAGDALVLAVHDDGPGVDAAPDHAPTATPTGVGLRNTVARLEQLYGPLDAARGGSGEAPRHRFVLRTGPGGGAVAELRLPVRTAVTAGSPPAVVAARLGRVA